MYEFVTHWKRPSGPTWMTGPRTETKYFFWTLLEFSRGCEYATPREVRSRSIPRFHFRSFFADLIDSSCAPPQVVSCSFRIHVFGSKQTEWWMKDWWTTTSRQSFSEYRAPQYVPRIIPGFVMFSNSVRTTFGTTSQRDVVQIHGRNQRFEEASSNLTISIQSVHKLN